MSSYIGRHAELYDIFYSEKPYGAEAAFVDECLRSNSAGKAHRVLELACGTGRHAVELEKLGYDLLATDYSADLLEVARERARHHGSRVTFEQHDMRALDVAEESFDAAICLFDAIGYVQTNEGVAATLNRVHRALRPGGLFLFEFWHAAAMLRSFEPCRVREWRLKDRTIVRMSQTVLIPAQQLARVTYRVHELCDDGTFRQLEEAQLNRYFLLQEMVYFLTSASFELVAAFDGFTPKREIDETTWHIVAIARKPVSSAQ
jgi:SAM-dependent methyltransferase